MLFESFCLSQRIANQWYSFYLQWYFMLVSGLLLLRNVNIHSSPTGCQVLWPKLYRHQLKPFMHPMECEAYWICHVLTFNRGPLNMIHASHNLIVGLRNMIRTPQKIAQRLSKHNNCCGIVFVGRKSGNKNVNQKFMDSTAGTLSHAPQNNQVIKTSNNQKKKFRMYIKWDWKEFFCRDWTTPVSSFDIFHEMYNSEKKCVSTKPKCV